MSAVCTGMARRLRYEHRHYLREEVTEKTKCCDVLHNSFFSANKKKKKFSAALNACLFVLPLQSQMLIWQFLLLLQANINWVKNSHPCFDWTAFRWLYSCPSESQMFQPNAPTWQLNQLHKIVNHRMQWGCQMVGHHLSLQNFEAAQHPISCITLKWFFSAPCSETRMRFKLKY